MIEAGRTDDELKDILQLVYISYIPAREGGLDAVKNWKDVFSGGEKQRIQLGRLFYHKPRYAVLDGILPCHDLTFQRLPLLCPLTWKH
jgi:ATP-binding cassette subfamily D (ALD) long-chain fatty acid import protein